MSERPERNIGNSFAAEALSIPNILTYFRLMLIPVFMVLYMGGEYEKAFVCLLASGISDILDGRIARKYNMITDLGKVADPVADKLTQCAMIFCAAENFPLMWKLLAMHITKELIMALEGWYVLKRTGCVHSAKWYGKLCTAVMYVVMMLHVIMPAMPDNVSAGMIYLCMLLVFFSFLMYTMRYAKLLRRS